MVLCVGARACTCEEGRGGGEGERERGKEKGGGGIEEREAEREEGEREKGERELREKLKSFDRITIADHSYCKSWHWRYDKMSSKTVLHY